MTKGNINYVFEKTFQYSTKEHVQIYIID